MIFPFNKFWSCPQVIDLFSQFFCWNKVCPDYGINNQGNIVLKEKYGKNNHALLKCKTCTKCFSETRCTVFFQLNTPEKEILRTLDMVNWSVIK
jgi:hypothetical protein